LGAALALSPLLAAGQSVTRERGAEVFQSHCARCHIDIELNVRLGNWIGLPATELHQRIRATMPGDSPGSLTDEEYLAATLHVLGMTATTVPGRAIEESALAGLSIEAAAGDGSVAGAEVAWSEYNGNLAAQRYTELDQINADNFAMLEVAWTWSAGMFGPSPEFKNVSSPLMVDGTLYVTVGATRNVAAIDAVSGQLLWIWRPQEGERFTAAPRKNSGRGLAYWEKDGISRIITVTPGYHMVSLNPATGEPDPNFGAAGWIDLKQGLRLGEGRKDIDIGSSMPPLVIDDVIVVGSAHAVSYRPPSAANVKGDVRGFDARTGKLLWTFHTIPAAGEPGFETWLEGSADFTGNAGVWGTMSADPELGLVYLPVESATGDRYGGDRPGNNLFSSSLVAVNAKSGEMRWYYQLVHHDIWDYDNPSAPILADLPNGRKVVVQLTKQSFAYVFDRVTGEPIWPIVERPVPQTDVPGEWTAPTQPFPTKPAPYDQQGILDEDLVDFAPEILAAAKEAVADYRLGPLFQPPSLAEADDGTIGTLNVPSSQGGSNWEGGALDPETGILYVPSRTFVEVLSLAGDPGSTVRFVQSFGRAPRVMETLQVIKPPWGRITAIDLNSGDHLWQIANADTPEDVRSLPALAGVTLPRTGIPTKAGLLVTPSILIAGEGWTGSAVLRAHDKRTGEILAAVDLPATQAGQPITYLIDDKQYIAMFVGDGTAPAQIVTLSLPDEPAPVAATPRADGN
jgi:quinoprotein glucose dehydrogenase